MKRKILVLLAIVLVVSLGVLGNSNLRAEAAEEKITVMVGTVLAETHPLQELAYYFQARVDEIIPGRIEWKNYINSALGSERDIGESVLEGTLQGAVLGCAPIRAIAPMTSVLLQDTPFLFHGVDQVYDALDAWYKELMNEEYASYNLLNISYFVVGGQDIENTVRPLRTPEDLKGLKIRVYEAMGPYKFIEGCGGMAISMNFGEVYTAIQQGTIDGVFTSSYAFVPQKFIEVSKYHSRLGITHTAQSLTFNKTWFESLPQDVQDAFNKAGLDTEKYCREVIAPNCDEKDYTAIEAAGLELNSLTDEEYNNFRKVMSEYCWEDFRKEIGPEIWDRAIEWLEKDNAR